MISYRAAALLVMTAAACGTEPGASHDRGERTSSVASPIIRGSDSTAEQDAVVLVVHYDAIKIGGGTEGCTGTLLTPRLILTARHCVSVTDESAACDADGNATFGAEIQADHPAKKLYAFSGAQRPDFISGLDKAARGAEIIDDESKTLCNHDLALLLLDRDLPGGLIAPVRLDGGPRQDEMVRVVGWGVTDKGPNPAIRQQRGGVKILTVGPADRLGPSEFKVGESVCAGDSGGPAISESTGAVLGVLSRGGNGKGTSPGDPDGCVDSENVFTSAAKYKDLILSAYEKAGQAPWLEGEPDPRTLPPPPPPSTNESKSGCAIAPRRDAPADSTTFIFVAALAALALVDRRKRA